MLSAAGGGCAPSVGWRQVGRRQWWGRGGLNGGRGSLAARAERCEGVGIGGEVEG